MKFNLNFYGASKDFMKAFKDFKKPFETPQRGVEIKISLDFFSMSRIGKGKVNNKLTNHAYLKWIISSSYK